MFRLSAARCCHQRPVIKSCLPSMDLALPFEVLCGFQFDSIDSKQTHIKDCTTSHANLCKGSRQTVPLICASLLCPLYSTWFHGCCRSKCTFICVQLFVCIANPARVKPCVSSSFPTGIWRLSPWRAHWTGGKVTSWASFKKASVSDICVAANLVCTARLLNLTVWMWQPLQWIILSHTGSFTEVLEADEFMSQTINVMQKE